LNHVVWSQPGGDGNGDFMSALCGQAQVKTVRRETFRIKRWDGRQVGVS